MKIIIILLLKKLKQVALVSLFDKSKKLFNNILLLKDLIFKTLTLLFKKFVYIFLI